MTEKKIKWNNGSGYFQLSFEGVRDGEITITSDKNDLSVARSQTVTISTSSGTPAQSVVLTIKQGELLTAVFNDDFNNDFKK